jgi:2-iminobutanoate/2-iminopropanoate deaminase
VTYVSGCIGLSKDTGALVIGGIEEETRQALENLKSIVLASGSDLSRVLKTTILLADMQYFKVVNAIYAEYFPTDPPARATFAVLGLPAGALIEIECICADRIA